MTAGSCRRDRDRDVAADGGECRVEIERVSRREKSDDASGLLRPRARSEKGLQAVCCYGDSDAAYLCLNDGSAAM